MQSIYQFFTDAQFHLNRFFELYSIQTFFQLLIATVILITALMLSKSFLDLGIDITGFKTDKGKIIFFLVILLVVNIIWYIGYSQYLEVLNWWDGLTKPKSSW